MLAINGAQESMPDIIDLPETILERHTSPELGELIGSPQIDRVMSSAFEQATLPSNLAVEWARSGRTVDLRHYDHFPQMPIGNFATW